MKNKIENIYIYIIKKKNPRFSSQLSKPKVRELKSGSGTTTFFCLRLCHNLQQIIEKKFSTRKCDKVVVKKVLVFIFFGSKKKVKRVKSEDLEEGMAIGTSKEKKKAEND